LKVAAWYMRDSRDEAHWMLPPRDSISSSMLSALRRDEDLKASRSIMCETPRRAWFSYREPAST
jgi:hypothetical protein